VESVTHTAKLLGPKMDENRLINELTGMIYLFLLGETGPVILQGTPPTPA
jgi:hypothetical protein